jgi:hypothetical protein
VEHAFAALELIMGTSQSVVAMARKLTTPKLKTRTVIVPKEKVVHGLRSRSLGIGKDTVYTWVTTKDMLGHV